VEVLLVSMAWRERGGRAICFLACALPWGLFLVSLSVWSSLVWSTSMAFILEFRTWAFCSVLFCCVVIARSFLLFLSSFFFSLLLFRRRRAAVGGGFFPLTLVLLLIHCFKPSLVLSSFVFFCVAYKRCRGKIGGWMDVAGVWCIAGRLAG